ncbi:hypothetical protein [Thermomonas sp. HDW16]|uniref:hypothetical protein n=1 Tax=Thermomonas sp. HDW16 TaxID=2714945 RepID=UPI001407E3AB|nr:hypothetical protein [Thermomonas sp. HDW16]QIL21091.1 hypothetical protein G7079_10330 [Thermomonas sp. HDW16]
MTEIFVVQVEASPDGVMHSTTEFGGAYINVYTTELNIRNAIDIAEKEVVEAGWRIERVVSAALNNAADFDGEESGLQYYEQALLDGTVVVVHIFPPEHAECDFLH